jgi:hypothetical protein
MIGPRTAIDYCRTIAVNIIVLGLLLVVLEGLASYTILLYDIATTAPLVERRHTQYDADLGWVHVPGIRIADLYGPDKYLAINSQGFRSERNFDLAVPNGKLRIICSGDSFTLGYGVDNTHAWCELLTSFDPGLETLNMGQGGYGVDQVYLWYRRDGLKFAHQIQLLSFITDDFLRMPFDSFYGYAKPVLKERNGALVIDNVPVPRRTYEFSWLTTQVGNVSQLRTFQFVTKALRKVGLTPRNAPRTTESDAKEETKRVLRKIFEDLKRKNEMKGSRLVLVLFPVEDELLKEPPHEWIEFIETESNAQGIMLINLFDDFHSLPRKDILDMFGTDWHFTERGNEFAARVIYERLRNEPSLAQLFSLHRHDGQAAQVTVTE